MNMLDKFYLIVDNSKILEELVPLGVKLVQLRIKSSNLNLLDDEILAAKTICAKYNCRLIINDHWQLAYKHNIKYVHLGQEDLQNCDIEQLAQTNLQIGVSTHDERELKIALELQSKINISYIALGPIYPTRLKKMPFPPQGLAKISPWKSNIGTIPLVAIGGLTPARAKLCLAAGADSAAVVTDISLNANPKLRTLEWIELSQL